MKKSLLLLLMLCLGTQMIGQNGFAPFVWKMAIYQKKVDGTVGVLEHGDYVIKAMYKDDIGDLVLAEEYTRTININSSWLQFFKVGETLTEPPKHLFGRIHSVCYEIIKDGVLIAEDVLRIAAVPLAETSYGLGSFSFRENPSLEMQDLLNGEEQEYSGLFGFRRNSLGTDEVSAYRFQGSYGVLDVETKYDDQPFKTGMIGTGSPKPLVFGQVPPDKLEGFYTVCIPDLSHFHNGLVIQVKSDPIPPDNRSSTDHPTAAIYAENIQSPMGVGVFANGASRGVYSQGLTGVIGLTVGTTNGTAVWGRVQTAPATGEFKYGVLGDSQGFTDSWAAAFFGNGFYTGTWTLLSDARVKTQVRNQIQALDKIMQLRPTQYEYVTNSGYHFPSGLHHGFIAQEVESILPELVSDIKMPSSLEGNLDETDNNVYKGINYTELIAVLTAAVQELNIKTEAQAAEIALLKEIIKNK